MLATGWSYPELQALPEGYVDILIKTMNERQQQEASAALRARALRR